MAHRRNQNVPTARFDIIEPDRKMSVLHAILRKEFTSCLTMQDVSIYVIAIWVSLDLEGQTYYIRDIELIQKLPLI